jgi:colanic acid biosynthesis glycosyl transferase WcaI
LFFEPFVSNKLYFCQKKLSPKKAITIFTGNYAPEDTAIGLYTSQFAAFLSNKGYDVSVITGFPYYPKWEIADEYKSKSTYFNEIINGITIFRYKQYVPKKVSFINRIKLMLSLLWGNYNNAKKIKETNLVICIVPFTISVLTAYLLARKTNAKLWVHVQDFEFDLAFQSGVLHSSFLGKIVKKSVFALEKYLFKKADVLSTISFNMIEKSKEKTNSDSIYYFPNWISSKNINPNTAKQHSFINKDKFTLLYSGNIGEKQDWNLFEKLCEKLVLENVEIVIVGNGAYTEKLKTRLINFDFIRFYEPIPYNDLNDLLCSADVHFLFQKTDVLDTVMPSKILGMMASGKPSLITGNRHSEVARIFKDNKIDGFFDSNEMHPILNFIKIEKANKENSLLNDEKAKKFVLENFSHEKILKTFEEEIQKTLY